MQQINLLDVPSFSILGRALNLTQNIVREVHHKFESPTGLHRHSQVIYASNKIHILYHLNVPTSSHSYPEDTSLNE